MKRSLSDLEYELRQSQDYANEMQHRENLMRRQNDPWGRIAARFEVLESEHEALKKRITELEARHE